MFENRLLIHMHLDIPFQYINNLQSNLLPGAHKGINISSAQLLNVEAAHQQFQQYLAAIGLNQLVLSHLTNENEVHTAHFRLNPEWVNLYANDYDTLQLCQRYKLDTFGSVADLEQEILLTMLMSPVAFTYPSYQELISALHIRKNIVLNARKTALAFATEAAERPEEYWTYHEDTGFTLIPGQSLITALEKATQPDKSGKLYSFSCYRATEYVILLSLAQELSQCNPELYLKLQQQWEQKAIMSAKFHDVFLLEYGSTEKPLPQKFYIPGDRLWFRNPDKYSAETTGYEGSWVFYLGNGQFSNFWNYAKPYTLTDKCVEIYHWRNAVFLNASGEQQMDEAKVEALVRESMTNHKTVEEILVTMMHYRAPRDVDITGGCIDSTREYPRLACPTTTDIAI
jgi:hypothetical protein